MTTPAPYEPPSVRAPRASGATASALARPRGRRPCTRGLTLGAVFVALSAIGVSGCGQAPVDSSSAPVGADPTGPAAANDTRLGAVALDLQIGGMIPIDTVRYDIGGGAFRKTGTIDVSNSRSASALIDAIPFGTGYVATMTATSTGVPRVECSGSSSFDVTATDVTAVPVHLTCTEAPTGSPPAAPVPVPSNAMFALSGLLLAFGLARLGRADRPSTVRHGVTGHRRWRTRTP